MNEKYCLECGKELLINNKFVHNKKYCSRSCQGKYWYKNNKEKQSEKTSLYNKERRKRNKENNKKRKFDSSMSKTCPRCEKEVPLTPEYFYKDSSSDTGLSCCCKKCLNEQHRKDYVKNKYGIEENDYNKMFNKYNGCCWICGVHQSKFSQKLNVDHDHKTDEVRGILCSNCNRALGYFKDNTLSLVKAIKYLNGDKN